MFSEIVVTLQNDEEKFIKKFLIYEDFTVSEDDPIISECIDLTRESFIGEVQDVNVVIKLEIV